MYCLDITEKTNNVTNAFMFFNLTTGFQFSELGNRLSELETQISDQRSQSSNRVKTYLTATYRQDVKFS